MFFSLWHIYYLLVAVLLHFTFNEALHPPTGLVQWVSQFHVDQQRTRPVEIQRLLVRYLNVTQGRCEVLVRRMVKRTGRVALLREVCDF